MDESIDIRVLEQFVPYEEGAESEVLGVLEQAADRSAGSGAGTGALSRTIAETGAQLVALEGSLARAQALATRCGDLANVTVVASSLDEFRDADGFDVVVAVGVLEYASSRRDGASGAQAFLERARSLLRPDGALLRIDDSVLLWRFDSGRRRRWRRTISVHDTSAGRVIRRQRAFDGEPAAEGWLTQRCPAYEPLYPGRTLERLVLEACGTGDLDAVDACLRRWRGFLSQHVAAWSGRPRPCPFGAGVEETALPGRFLDVNLANFVESGDDLAYVDDEWQVADCVSLELVALRALWYLARVILSSCATHPWSPAASVASLTGMLAARCGLPGDASSIARLHAAECEFLAIVTHADPHQIATQLAAEGAYTARGLRRIDELPRSALRADLRELRERLRTTDDQLQIMSARAHELDHELQRILRRFPARIYLQLKRLLGRPVMGGTTSRMVDQHLVDH